MNIDPEILLEDIEEKAKEMAWPIVGSKKGKILRDLIKEYQPKNILEIGCLVGYSSILMSQELPKDGKITTIEKNSKIAVVAKENFKKTGLTSRIDLIVGDALEIIPTLLGPFDLVFIDASKDEYYNYLTLIEKKLAPNAVIVADNVKMFEHDMKKYLSHVRSKVHYRSETHDFGDDAMEISYKI